MNANIGKQKEESKRKQAKESKQKKASKGIQ